MEIPPSKMKIMYVNAEKAVEGTNLRVITLVLNPTKMVEGVEVPNRDRHQEIWHYLGRYHGNHFDESYFYS